MDYDVITEEAMDVCHISGCNSSFPLSSTQFIHEYITFFIFLFNAGLARPALSHGKNVEVTTDIFNRGLCLPSDNKQSREQGEVVIEVIKRCFL